MAAPVQQQVVHAYKLSGKLDPADNNVQIYVIDTVTKKKWESKFAPQYFTDYDFDYKGAWDLVKAAVSSQPPGWAAEYPEDGGNLKVNVQEGKWTFELAPAVYDENE